MKKITFRMWVIFILVGLAGQFAWSIENMYLNSYIAYLNFDAPKDLRFDYSLMISITTAASAIVATLTTIFMGALTDKVGHKKLFISLGYILWGISTACFGLFNVNSSSGKTLSITPYVASIFVIVFDLIMTFFGSTSNDASFNSYVTENTSDDNRGKVESVLSILPLISMIIIFVGLNNLTTKESGYRWDLFFYIVGAIVIFVGVISLFLIPREKRPYSLLTDRLNNDVKVTSLIKEGFKPSVIKENKNLYLILLVYFIFSVSNQVFFPYIMIYVEKTCAISNSSSSLLSDFAIVMASSLLGGSLLSLIFGFLADKYSKNKMIIPTLLTFVLGSIMMAFIPKINDSFKLGYCIISTLIMIIGYVSVPTILNSLVRDYIPKGKEGSFLGIRMLFVVLLPMCIGPFIGNYLNSINSGTYLDSYNIETKLPSSLSYIVGPSIILLCVIPLVFYFKMNRSKEYEKK